MQSTATRAEPQSARNAIAPTKDAQINFLRRPRYRPRPPAPAPCGCRSRRETGAAGLSRLWRPCGACYRPEYLLGANVGGQVKRICRRVCGWRAMHAVSLGHGVRISGGSG